MWVVMAFWVIHTPATYVGSTQIDKETESKKNLDGNFKVVYTTPEKFFDDTGNPVYPLRDLITHTQIGLISIDDCHPSDICTLLYCAGINLVTF